MPFNLDHATLEDDPDFTIENHVKFHQLPADTSEAQLIEAAMAVFRKPLDRNRPLWEVNLFNGFKGNRSVVMWTIHHCLVDGVSGMELLNVVMDFRPDPPATESNARAMVSKTSSRTAATGGRRRVRPRAGAGRLDAPPESKGPGLSVVG